MSSGPATDRCTFLPPIGDEQRMTDMRDRILVSRQTTSIVVILNANARRPILKILRT